MRVMRLKSQEKEVDVFVKKGTRRRRDSAADMGQWQKGLGDWEGVAEMLHP